MSVVLAMGVVYYLFDPVEAGWMPRCLWKSVTGTDCPGCGSQRMAHALMHGDINGAWHANAFALCMLPVIVFLLWLETVRDRYPRLYAAAHRPGVIITVALSVVIWWVCRNILNL
ncbi:MAG: DUF2752 domain-containing protein [Muribaculaceae bacterium]|nr:DUF2752 domain-containing protein [Muribaculaceae bacterium]MDE7096326.1 DUF2752 domain-containing protein [Muribaculaceae bacterium]